MKKIITAVFACLIIAATFASCYDPANDPNMKIENGTIAATEATTQAATEAPKDTDYKNNLDGLRDYLAKLNFITIEAENKNVTDMKSDLIGAEKGYKIASGDVKVEIYEFNLKKDNKTRDDTIAQVKKDGTFKMYGKTIPAYLSDNGKYLMVYTDARIKEGDTSSEEYKTMQKAISAFKEFNK